MKSFSARVRNWRFVSFLKGTEQQRPASLGVPHRLQPTRQRSRLRTLPSRLHSTRQGNGTSVSAKKKSFGCLHVEHHFPFRAGAALVDGQPVSCRARSIESVQFTLDRSHRCCFRSSRTRVRPFDLMFECTARFQNFRCRMKRSSSAAPRRVWTGRSFTRIRAMRRVCAASPRKQRPNRNR